MSIRIASSTRGGSGGNGVILGLLASWRTSGNWAGACISTQSLSLPWIFNRVHQHQTPMISIVRQFHPTSFLLARRVIASAESQTQPKSESIVTRKKKGVSLKRWTLEDDVILFKCFLKHMPINDIYAKFPTRSPSATASRAWRLRNAHFLINDIERDGGQISIDQDSLVQHVQALRPFIRMSAETMKYKSKELLYRPSGGGQPFSQEEKELLVKLVDKYRDSDMIWSKVSGGRLVDEEGAPTLRRARSSCRSAWESMQQKGENIRKGWWDSSETQRFEAAIEEQIGDKFTRYVDVDGGWRLVPAMTIESGTKPALSEGGKPLVDWKLIADKVGTRTKIQCKRHFYETMLRKRKEKPWTAEELRLLHEGLNLYGTKTSMVANHIGTRSARQTLMKAWYISNAKKDKKIK
ncbi:hypothetical protein BGX27_005579, partial [Mortierella sp. AM989]